MRRDGVLRRVPRSQRGTEGNACRHSRLRTTLFAQSPLNRWSPLRMLSFVASFAPPIPRLPGLPSRCSGPSWLAQMGSPRDRRFPHCSRLPQCRLEDRGLDRPSHSHHRPRDAALRPRTARHSPRRCRVQFAGAGGPALRGQLVGGSAMLIRASGLARNASTGPASAHQTRTASPKPSRLATGTKG
jgi:hypothetical protein